MVAAGASIAEAAPALKAAASMAGMSFRMSPPPSVLAVGRIRQSRQLVLSACLTSGNLGHDSAHD
jgi:hypothetical protein